MTGSERARARVSALVAHAQRFPSLVDILGQPAERRVQDQASAGRPPIASIDVGGHLLQILDGPGVEFRQPAELITKARGRLLRAAMRFVGGSRIAIQMIDESGIEGGLLLEIRRHRSPDETGEAPTPSRLGGRRGGSDVPGIVNRRKLRVIDGPAG